MWVPPAVAVLLLLLSTACSDRFGAPRPASEQGSEILDLWRVLFLVGAAIGIFVAGLILWSIVRYRRRPGTEPATFRANVPLEIVYTAIPLVIVAILFGLTLRSQHRVTRTVARPDVNVDITGFQWGWRFIYPDHQITVIGDVNRPPTLVLPVGQIARLRLSSPDVIHSFFVPAFLEKRDVVPGVENRIDVTPTRVGRFDGHCAEFCGLDHGRMNFIVEVVTPEQFSAWTTRQPQPTATSSAVMFPDPSRQAETGTSTGPRAASSGPTGRAPQAT